MLRHIAALIAVVAMMASAAPAEPAANVKGVEVHYGDLDLSTPDGAKSMLERIKRAAWDACKLPPGTPVQRRCIAETVTQAVADLKAPEVTRSAYGR